MVSPSRRLVDPPASVRKWQVRELAADPGPRLWTTRSGSIYEALRAALERYDEAELEERHSRDTVSFRPRNRSSIFRKRIAHGVTTLGVTSDTARRATGVTPAPIYFNPPPNPLVNPFWTNPTSNSIGSEARNPMAESLPQKVSSSVISVAMKVASANFEGDWMNRSA